MLITAKNHVPAKKGMVFNINVGFSDLKNSSAKDEEGKKYALFVGETVLVNEVSFHSLTEQVVTQILRIPARVFMSEKILAMFAKCGKSGK